ncbi:RNA-DNA hybrid ribonuclease [Geranomyces variabilis]|uniref:ribonuclease H n=1 Tax=Geranomyces variabilis TaxID=109894 RepID=A0AAD5TIN3_9FUNG|nr:RNA-DNA hybrid ribonuclease [Geranomyces variabilis]
MPFYAVVRGRQPGIYESWPETKAQVDGFRGSMQKKFPTKGDAQAFMDQHSPGWRSSGAGRAAPGSDGSAGAAGTPTTKPSGAADDMALVSREELRKLEQLAATARAKRSARSPSPPSPPPPPRGDTLDDDRGRGRATSHTAAASSNKRRRSASPVRTASPAVQIPGGGYLVNGEFNDWAPLPEERDDVEDGAFDEGLMDDAELMAFMASYGGETAATNTSSAAADQRKFYVVLRGRVPGIYDTFNEAQAQVTGQYTLQPKSFTTREAAEAYLAAYNARNSPSSSDPDPLHPSTLVAFTDGSALGNGKQGCRAGWAVVFPHNESWNWAEKMMAGRLTNNAAEYLAAHAAIKRANDEDPARAKPLYIFSDSMLLINTMQMWVEAWRKNNWKKRDGTPVMNAPLLQSILAAKGSRRVLWRHVKAHSGRKDWRSVWNDKADRMAKGAALGLPGPTGPSPLKMQRRIAKSASRGPAGRGRTGSGRGNGRPSRGARSK